ncbi:hypothetical protein MTO96_038284 [Rhipicephalus appendiculatus]
MAWLIEQDSDIRTKGLTTCAKPWSLKGKELRVLAYDDFFKWEDECEPGCQCECYVGSHGRQQIAVNCSSVTVGIIPKVFPEGVLAVLLALSAAYQRYKDLLRTWLRGRGVSGSAWCIGEDDAEKLFDVFVSFTSKDIDLVHVELLPGLEAMDFSCCTYERNFKGAYLLQDIIRDAVAYSRRTLLVLTE